MLTDLFALSVFIQVVHQNSNRLSLNKRKSYFEWMRGDEISRFEQIVAKGFAPNVQLNISVSAKNYRTDLDLRRRIGQ